MSGLDSGNSKDYSKYDGMSTESLEELLRLDAELPDGEGADIDEILYISEVIAKREKEHPTGRYAEADVEAAWETFQTKYLPYVTDGRSLFDFDDEQNRTGVENPVADISSPSGKKLISLRGRRRLSRGVSLVAVAAALLGLMTVTAYAMGYDIWGVIAQWTKDTFTFVPASKVSTEENPNANIMRDDGEYADLQAALDDYGITESLAPCWFPDGFSLDSVNVDENTDPDMVIFQATYRRDEQWIVIQLNKYQAYYDVTYAGWEKDDVDVDILKVENCEFYLLKNMGRECAIWSNGPFECSIISDISSEELSKVIRSIYDRNG